MNYPRRSNPGLPRTDRQWHLLLIGLLVGDLACIGLAFIAATYLRYGDWLSKSLWSADSVWIDWLVLASILGVVILLFRAMGLYDPDNLLGGAEEYGRAVTACSYAILAIVGASYFLGGTPAVGRSWLVLFWGLTLFLVIGWRFAARRVVYQMRKRGRFIRRVLIAGANNQGVAIARQIDSRAGHGVEVVGFVDDYQPIGTMMLVGHHDQQIDSIEPICVLGDPGDVARLATELQVDELIVVTQALTWESYRDLVEAAALGTNGYALKLAPTQYDILATRARPSLRGQVPLFSLERAQIAGFDAWLKGALDYGLAIAGLAVLGPLVGILALLGRSRGDGTALERRQVEGRWGQRFELLLLGGPARRCSLLRGIPALWNVLRGQISLVGPRPVAIGAVGSNGSKPPRWRPELAVKPGLVGPWRLAGREVSREEVLALDLWYVRNYTIWEDLRILFQTARTLIRPGQGKTRGIGRWEGAIPDQTGPTAIAGRG